MKRTMNRLFARLAILCVAVILGAVAVMQAQRGLQNSEVASVGATPPTVSVQPIPSASPADMTMPEVGYRPETPAYPDPPAPAYVDPPAPTYVEPPAPVYPDPPAPVYPDPPAVQPAPPSYDSVPEYGGGPDYTEVPEYGAPVENNDNYLDPPGELEYAGGYVPETAESSDVDVVQYLTSALGCHRSRRRELLLLRRVQSRVAAATTRRRQLPRRSPHRC